MIDVNLSTFDAHNGLFVFLMNLFTLPKFLLGYPSQTQLLHIAARQNDSVLIRLLIKTYKARVNIFDEDGCTPLHICCYEDNIDALKALLENDADFQKGTRLNPHETPISICVKYQHDLCLKSIFDLTINFNWKRYFSQLPRSPLLCDFPSIYSIELLVEHSLDINACDERGNTFLHYLVNKKDIDYEKYIEILIHTSTDFNRQNRLGRTPFLEALEQKNFQLISVFLHHIEITNINIVDSLSNTALHYCKYINENNIYETVLQSNPSSLNAQNRDGQTPLHDAILCDNYSFARYLLQRGADLSLINKDGNTPLHLAARDDNTKMCKLLMKYPQLDLIAINKMGKTPLHLACANEKSNVAAILINKLKIEQLNILDIQGRTPLHECAENINGSLARYLIRHGADENLNDIRQNNVLHLATEKGKYIN
jgi:ankyrin repeat protein